MALKSIQAHNFKSFRDLRLDFGDLSVLIGANGAGKSNIVSLIRFVRDLANDGLENAVSLQGGSDFITNYTLGSAEPLELKIVLEPDNDELARWKETSKYRWYGPKPLDATYSLALSLGQHADSLVVHKDHLDIRFEIIDYGSKDNFAIGEGHISIRKKDGKITGDVHLPGSIRADEVFSLGSSWLPFLDTPEMAKFQWPRTLLEQEAIAGFIPRWDPFALALDLRRIAVYDIDVKLLKQAVQIQAKAELEEDGRNLAVVLRRILSEPKQRTLLLNLLSDILPFVTDVDTEQFADRYLVLKLRETFGNGVALPASLLSDGTVHIVALIVALYFSQRSLVVIEEPERHIHPYLIARVVELLKDASRNTKIVVTTQNPELVRHVELDSLALVTRDRGGFSTIQRPAESGEVLHFLQNEIGVAELFAQNLLGV